MAQKTLNVKLLLRGDEYSTWTTQNPVLMENEAAVVVIPADTGVAQSEPAVMLKVGDGTTAFNSLEFVSAKAADVYSWAKAATKPTYQANEIQGLDDYIGGKVEDTNTQYKLVSNGSNSWKLQKKDIGDEDYTDVEGSTITVSIPEIKTGSANGTISVGGSDVVVKGLGSAAYTASSDYDAAGSANTVKTQVIGATSDASSADTIKGAKKYADEKFATLTSSVNEKVASVKAGDASVTIGGTATAPTIAVKLSADSDNILTLDTDGLKVAKNSAPVYSVSKKSAAETGFIASYILTKDGAQVGETINIPKDYLVKSAEIKEATGTDAPYEGAAVGDKYIDFVVNSVEGSGNESHIYLAVDELVDTYTGGNGITVSGTNQISLKLGATTNGLSIDSSGLQLAAATASTAGAMTAADKTKLSGIATGATKVEDSSTNGNIKINGSEINVYTLPSTVLHDTDTLILNGGTAAG